MTMEVVVEAARMMGADRLVPIVSSHIDGCLYHGDAGVLYCEKLAEEGAGVAVPATTNVGSLNLLKVDQVKLPEAQRGMALRLMTAHRRMGCRPTWTCAPYQTEARPALGEQIAWGESNAVAFANTVLGARTNRYGDFLDLACTIAGRAPDYGLHRTENRAARLMFEVSGLPGPLLREDAFFAVLGALVGQLAGDAVSAVDGIPGPVQEDQLKSFCAAAAGRDDDQLGEVRLLRPRQHRVRAGVRHALRLHPERPGGSSRARPGDLGMSWQADVLIGGSSSASSSPSAPAPASPPPGPAGGRPAATCLHKDIMLSSFAVEMEECDGR